MPRISILLDNIRSVHNVGSIFRTAETAGVEHIYLIGTTPTPTDRFGRDRADMAKVALGAEKLVPWTYSKTAASLIRKLKKEGCEIVAIEQDKRAIDFKEYKPAKKILYILGNEVGGVSKSLLDAADVILEIPQKGTKESLNVSVVTGIILYNH